MSSCVDSEASDPFPLHVTCHNMFLQVGNGGNTVQSTSAWGGGTSGAWGSTNTVPTPTTLPPSTFNSTPSPVGVAGGSKKEKDLDRREAELNRREAELRRLETELRSNPASGGRKKNWPMFCSCVHHDINAEVPDEMRSVVRGAYYAYLGLVLALFWNLMGTVVALVVKSDKLSAFLWGALYFVGGIPGAWFLWYGRIYRASIKDSAFGYGLFFLFFSTAHLIFTGWSAIGPPILNDWSHTGFWVAVQNVRPENNGLAIVYYIGGALWSIEFLWSFWVLKRVYAAFRGKGHTAADVKRDAARSAASAAV